MAGEPLPRRSNMPSTSPAQAKLMSAIAHGWRPAGASHLPPLAVAKEFHEADKKVGKYMHYKAEGGKVGTLVNFGKSLMDRLEGAFHNPYTANPDQVRQDIARYWHLHQPPAAIAAPVKAPEPTVEQLTAQLHELANKSAGIQQMHNYLDAAEQSPGALTSPPGMADGGPVRHRVRTLPRTDQPAGLKMDPLQLISHAADRVSAAVGDDPHHMLARIAGGLTSQIAGLSPQGTAEYGRVPGIVDETKALPAGLTDLGTGLAALEGAGADAAASKGFHSPVIGMVQALRDKLAAMHDKYGDLAPKWSRDAEARTNQLHDAVHKQMGLTPAHGFAENAAEAGGMMMGQIPIVGQEEKAASMLAKLAKSPIEWLSPSIRPKLSNYLAGTLAGGALGTAADPNVPTPQVADNSMPIEERFE